MPEPSRESQEDSPPSPFAFESMPAHEREAFEAEIEAFLEDYAKNPPTEEERRLLDRMPKTFAELLEQRRLTFEDFQKPSDKESPAS